MEHAKRIAFRVREWLAEELANEVPILQIAKRSGIRQQTLFRIAKGLQPTVTADQFARIVKALRVPASEWKAALFGGLELPKV